MGATLSTRLLNWALCFVFVCLSAGCGGGGSASTSSSEGSGTSTAQPSVTVNPAASNVRPGDPAVQFTATVTGTSSTAVTWSVNGTAGGSAAGGLVYVT